MPSYAAVSRAKIAYPLCKSLNACVHSFCLKPRMHQSIQSGSMARAASAMPMSVVSQPN